MRVFIAGTSCAPEELETFKTSPYILESFVYFKGWQKPLIKTAERFFVDSGAFTFRKKAGKTSWENFIERYAEFIVSHDIQDFFELDIDNIVGYDRVQQYTRLLERLTGRRSIPVWHPNRGKKEFERMCDGYDYVSIGGIAGANHKTKQRYRALFPWFISEAHKRGAEIHGLGFTAMKSLEHVHFDSVDSTSWTSAGRFGTIYQFNGKRLDAVKTEDRRIVNRKMATHHNLVEWIKFQQYAKEQL